MRTYVAVLALFTALSAAFADDISRNPSVSLGDEKLYLAFVENDGDVLLNEYIRKEESFENWKVLFAVRYVRSAKSVDEVVARWKAYLTQVSSPGKALKEAEESNASDRRFALAIRPRRPGACCDELTYCRSGRSSPKSQFECCRPRSPSGR
ncbi:MAG: hypothetical protein HC814_02440 [Rhodobacteraceae bacterium]|nr:hypothetical protein [Paracoccaceae bacterium]